MLGKENWLFGEVRRALGLTLEMLNDTAQDVSWRKKLETSQATKSSIILNGFGAAVQMLVLISVSAVCLAMLPMAVGLAIVKPKAFAKRSEPVQLLLTEVPQFDTKDQNYRWMKDDFKV